MLRKRHQYRILTAAFLFALIGVAFFAGYAGMRSSTQSNPTTPPAESSHHWGQKPEGFWERWSDPVAVATLALVFVTLLMTRAIRAQVRLARDEFNATHRPRIQIISFEESSVSEGASEHFALGASLGYVNAGDTDAHLIEIGWHISAADRRFRPGVTMKIRKCGGQILTRGKEGGYPLASNVTRDNITVIQMQNDRGENDPPLHLRCVGYVLYADDGGSQRRSGFSRIYDPRTRRWDREENPDYEYSY
jgi:hypothetical protein